MNNNAEFAKSSVVYFLGNIFSKVILFFLLPLYTKYISPSSYGYYDVSITYITLIASMLFLDIWSGIMRYMFDYDGKNDKLKPIYNGLIIFLGSLVLYSVIVFIFSLFSKVPYLRLIFLYGLLLNTQNVFSYISRGFGQNVLFAVSGVISTIVTAVSNIVLIVFVKIDYSSLYISACLGWFVQIVMLESRLKLISGFSLKYLNRDILSEMFRYSIPLCINSLGWWFLACFDKIVISQKLSIADNGYYAVAGKFPAALALVTTCFNLAWQETAFSKGSEDNGRFYSKASNTYIRFLCMGLLLIIPVVKIVFPFMVNRSYQEAELIIPLFLLATGASIFSDFTGSIFGAIKKTSVLFYSTLAACVINFILIYSLIGKIGLCSANIAMFVSFLTSIAIRILILRKYMNIKINRTFLIYFSILFILSSFIYYKFGLIANILSFIIALLLCLYIFSGYIKMFIKKVKPEKEF